MKKICFLLLMVIASRSLHAQQAALLQAGKITFERKENAWALMQEMRDSNGIKPEAFTEYKTGNPAFKNTLFTLYFKDAHTLYKPASTADAAPASMAEWFSMVANSNTIYTDLDSARQLSEKQVFGTAFSVSDVQRKIRWKITPEMRDIAGFQCRRANALIMDSIYVVAYFTNEIMVSGGPESFSGLPGMILGLALPHEHITWFATKVDVQAPDETLLHAPKDNKALSRTDFSQRLLQMTKSWNNVGPLILRRASL